ncbi:hypothetical protein PMN2A_1238 [Prochlorococcus marinus str. NATL2A]|uniref:Sugar O-methyltransferase n=1 Tax=Prochlorococcus marinus (strain NATL2A) TaxID=59920 RepID=Q46IF0_PROMT|nr:putative sugar O-methyltransferase [Prochlorococcus marinus]AAZ58728.1 hypothetical protein PMN2A_1238 [Prochlorococcus marinus str. NATL2A]
MSSKFKSSKLWQSICKNNLNKLNDSNISSFRDIGNINNRICSWDPTESSTRYFKTLLMRFIWDLEQKSIDQNLDMKQFIANIKNQQLGSPIYINYFDFKISLDYALCLEEILFLNKSMTGVSKILEIGAGFGRTCHALLSNFDEINQYIICDLPPIINLAKNYLYKVLNEHQFKKIIFISNEMLESADPVDLTININSFQEMESDVINNYIKFIAKKSRAFFCKNPICKYDPNSINLKIKDKNEFEYAMKLGLCKDIVDIFDPNQLQIAAAKYVALYRPKNFKIERNERSKLWPQHHSVLYLK